MRNRLIIIGAGGCGKVIADIALNNGYQDIAYIDDNAVNCMGFPVIGKCCDMERFNDGKTDFVISIGNNKIRKKIAEEHNVNWCTLVHPSAHVGINVKLGQGTVVMAGAVISPCADIGRHCIINTCALVEHDNIIEDFVHISPNAALGGTVKVGMSTHIGIGATVKNNINICDGCVIGAGAVVVKNITVSATYVGVPAVQLKKSGF